MDSPCEGEQSNDKDLPYSMEIKLQETDSHTRQERDHDFSLSKSQHNREVRDELISPPKCQPVILSEIKERADKIKIKLFVTPEKKKTRDQADCEASYRHKKPRITASKCKRALMRCTINPTTAMEEIMGMNSTVSSSFKKDEQLSECGIIKKNIQKSNVSKVSKFGLFRSEKYPFLATSPDGLVSENGLVEAKKIQHRENETSSSTFETTHL